MKSDMVALDKVQWNSDEDKMLDELHKHFSDDFEKIAQQLNKVFLYNKMTAGICKYRFLNYQDSKINRNEFSHSEETQILNMLKSRDLYSSQFWFIISDSFEDRPPNILKAHTLTFIHKYLQQLIEKYVQNKGVKKRFINRAKKFSIDFILALFRLGKERIKNKGCPSLLTQAIEQASQFMNYIEISITSFKHSLRLDDQSEKSIVKFLSMIECVIFIDTLYRIYHKIQPYNQDQKETSQNEESKNGFGIQFGQPSNMVEDQTYEKLSKEDIKLIASSNQLGMFSQYFLILD